VRALLAQALSHVHTDVDEAPAREGMALAEQLGDPDLRSWAWATRSAIAARKGQFEEAFECAVRRFDLEPEITDPDHLVEMRESAVPTAAALGRLREARRLADEHLERARRLSPHHRMHGVSLHVEIEEIAGDWETLRAYEPTVQAAVAENAATPCIRHQRCLLVCAAARAAAGETDEARALAATVEAMPQEGHAVALDPVRLRLAIELGDLDAVAALSESEPKYLISWGLSPATTRLDALAALRDRERLEREAPRFLRPSLVTEPYAQRALGLVREDAALLHAAVGSFEQRGMRYQAAATASLF
jgi:hypothetical protein